MQRVWEALAARLTAAVAAAERGHCVRIDDVAEPEALEIAKLMTDSIDPRLVKVAVLDVVTSGVRVDVQTAVGIRNDKSHVFALLVPPRQAHAASSLDNSFERLPLVAELDNVMVELGRQLTERWPQVPVVALLRAARVPVESKLAYLSAVLDSPDEHAYAYEMWRLGFFVDTSAGATLRANIEWNAKLVAAIVRPATVATTLRERLGRVGVAPGTTFETLIATLTASSDVRDSSEWTRRLFADHALKLTDIPRVHEADSDLESIEMQSFRKAGQTVESFSKLKETEEGALYAETSTDNPGAIGLRWKSRPAKPTDVTHWLLELLPPADLRTDETSSVLEMKVKGARASAQLKLELGADDLTGGSLFVVRITALDANATPMLLADGTLAASESDPFEVIIQEALTERSTRKASSGSFAEAQLKAVLAGASSTEVDMQTWDIGGSVYSLRVGNHLASQIRVAPVVVALQRRILSDPSITAFTATSLYGEPVQPEDAAPEHLEIPAAFSKRRREMFTLLKARAPHDVPEIFNWDEAARALAAEYAQTYKRALDAAQDETRQALLRLDTVGIDVGTATGLERALLVLPIHPLRIAWIAAHHGIVEDWCAELVELGSARARQLVVDESLFGRVQPTNLPFFAVGTDSSPFVYFDELAFGSAILLNPRSTNHEASASTVYGALGMARESSATSSAASMVASRIQDFRRSHPEADALRLASLNPGDGEVLGLAVEPLLTQQQGGDDVASVAPPRVEIVAYGRDSGFASPLPRLATRQRELQQAQVPGRQSHLAPRLGLAMRAPQHLVADPRSHHLSLIQDIGTQEVVDARDEGTGRLATFQDLLTPAITTRVETAGKPSWVTSAALGSTADAAGRAVIDAHRSHQQAIGQALGLGGPPALGISVEPESLEGIRVLHELSDWVLTLDRYVGLDLYEDPLSIGLGQSSYVLDYAPDFIEGLSHRLTVTTKHRGEVTRILERAMDELGLDAVAQSVTPVIENLLSISGRLVLRLHGSDNFAREAVSLAALVAHLRTRGQLDDVIIVPVDTHDEIFGRAAREPDQAARRCDILLVRVRRNGISIDCVEVKSRKAAALPTQLADDIVDQVEETRRLLISRFFATDPARIDAQLQRARLAGMLHYYADRAVTSRTLRPERLGDTHKLIDRHLESESPVDISMHGYVISLQGAAGFPARHRQVPITVLTANDLGAAGFTTKFDEPASNLDDETPSEKPTGNDQPAPASSRGSITSDEDTPADPLPAPAADPSAREGTSADATAGPPPVTDPGRADRSVGPGTESSQPDLAPTTRVPLHSPPPSTENTGERGDPGPDPNDATRHQETPGPEAASDNNPGASSTRTVEVLLGRDAHGADVRWPVSTQGSPHAFVLGIPGQGKSVTTRRIVSDFSEAGLPSLLLDFHGDMAAEPPAGATVVDASLGLPFSPFETVDTTGAAMNVVAFETAEVVAYVADLGEIQRAHVYSALQQAYTKTVEANGSGAPTVDEFAEALEEVEAAAKGKHARERVRPLTDFGLFRTTVQGNFDPRAGGMVIDVSRIPLHQVQLAAGAFLLRRIYRDMFFWPQDGTLKLAIVLDEAHRMAKDVTLPRLMKEGRKYGLCVVVASQGSGDFHKDVLGNAGTKIVFRTNFPESKQVAGYLRGRTGQDLSQEIEKLGVGQAYVSTPDSPQSRKLNMTP